MLRTGIAIVVLTTSVLLTAQTGAQKPDVQTRRQRPAGPAAEGKTPAEGTSAAQTATPKAASGVPDRALMQRIWDAWATLNPANVARFYAKDPNLVFYDIAPMKYNGWNEYAAGVTKLFAGFQSMKATIGDDARVYTAVRATSPAAAMKSKDGAGALGTATWHADVVNKDGTRQTLDGRWTVVWENRGGQWLIVHEHVSVPMK